VTGYLLDTSIALLSMTSPERIPEAVRRELDGQQVYLSVISYWEVLLKSSKGKLDVGDPRQWWTDTLDKLSATALHLRPEHVAEIYNLAPIHNDPFDRALIAQATVEELALVTSDREIPRYASTRLRVVS
jgi:PIN domain nuclease of toxin-antitoxin system